MSRNTIPSIGESKRLKQFDVRAVIRSLEGVTLASAAVVTILTYLMVGGAQVREYNPVTAGIIDTAGFYAFAGVRLAAVIGTFAVIYTVHEHAHDATVRYTAVAGALVAAALTTANAITDAYATITLGLPETVIVADVVMFVSVVTVSSTVWYLRPQLLDAGQQLRSCRTLMQSSSPSPERLLRRCGRGAA